MNQQTATGGVGGGGVPLWMQRTMVMSRGEKEELKEGVQAAFKERVVKYEGDLAAIEGLKAVKRAESVVKEKVEEKSITMRYVDEAADSWTKWCQVNFGSFTNIFEEEEVLVVSVAEKLDVKEEKGEIGAQKEQVLKVVSELKLLSEEDKKLVNQLEWVKAWLENGGVFTVENKAKLLIWYKTRVFVELTVYAVRSGWGSTEGGHGVRGFLQRINSMDNSEDGAQQAAVVMHLYGLSEGGGYSGTTYNKSHVEARLGMLGFEVKRTQDEAKLPYLEFLADEVKEEKK